MFTGISDKIALALALVVMLMIGGGYMYYLSISAKIANLQQENAALTTAKSLQDATIAAQKAETTKQNAQILQLQQSINDAQVAKNKLTATFQKHNLPELARKNSTDLEDKINAATVSAFDDITTLTQPKDRQPAVSVKK